MPDIENNFNNNDFNIISPGGNQDGTFGALRDYVRLSVFDENNNLVNYINGDGVNTPAIFYSALESSYRADSQTTIPFTIQGTGVVDGIINRDITFSLDEPFTGDFQIYQPLDSSGDPIDDSDFYIKPNELLSSFNFTEGDYKLKLDFLNQFPIAPAIEVPSEEFEPPETGGDGDNEGGDDQRTETYSTYGDPVDRFIIKEISPSRKEVRIKLLDLKINNVNVDTDIKTNFNEILGDPYEFNHVLNVGLARNIPITNYIFDKFTNGDDNQSIILKLYESLPNDVSTLQIVNIEKEVLVTQTQDIYYFSDVDEIQYGPTLPHDEQYSVPSYDASVDYQNFNELTSSLPTEVISSIYSGSSFDYPNLNTDFNEFENHTHFGSAERKLINFKEKVKTIQSNLSKISSSLGASATKITSTDTSVDSDDLIQVRETSFNNIQKEIDSFTPYERFLYFDGQSQSTSSAPGLGKNYARPFALNEDVNIHYDGNEFINNPEYFSKYSGLPSVYKVSSSQFDGQKLYAPNIFRNTYRVEDKPFFNYSGSVYLSFLVKGAHSASGGYPPVANRVTQYEDPLPFSRGPQYNTPAYGDPYYQVMRKATHLRFIEEPTMVTGSQYHRYVIVASASHWVPTAVVNFDTEDIGHQWTHQQGGTSGQIACEILSASHLKTGSSAIKVHGDYQYLATTITQSGVPFKGSILPLGDLFRLQHGAQTSSWSNTAPETGNGITASYFTDVKVTLENPINVQPFGQLHHTSSDEWQGWYNGMVASASAFDDDNIHSLENNLPIYIQESSDYDDVKKFLAMVGEHHDLIRNHVDGLGELHNRRYEKLDSVPGNLIPMLLGNLGWDSIIPFSSSLADYFGSSLSSITNESTISENTLRKVLNNLIYLYKSKGTANSVRALLNTYGYPPDVLQVREFGNSNQPQNGIAITASNPSIGITNFDTNLSSTTGNISFKKKKEKLYHYNFNKRSTNPNSRFLSLDWWMDNADVNTIEFIYKHKNTTDTQKIFKSSGSGTETLWDLRLLPSSDGLSSSFEFRLNNSDTGSANITGSAVSMSTNYTKMTDGQLWNVMLQRMTSSNTGNGINEYRLHTTLQQEDRIKVYNYITMSVSGATSASVRNSNYIANQNFIGSGSRHQLSSSNLVVGETLSGSLAEIRGWTTALSSSKFRLHTLNKLSTVGNNIDAHKDELIYHFKLNENYSSASISGSQTNVTIVDANPLGSSTSPTDYSFGITSSLVTEISESSLYSYDMIDVYSIGLQDNNQLLPNSNKIIIKPNQPLIGNLNPNKAAVKSIYSENSKPNRTNSVKLEINRSPQDFINNFILDKIQGYNLETLYGNPKDRYSSSYAELDTFRGNFFRNYDISVDMNRYVRGMENLFNQSLVDRIKKTIPARSTLSDEKAGFGVTIKPTILEKQKYEHKLKSFETNPNQGDGEINIITGSINTTGSELILPKSGSINIVTGSVSMSKGEVVLPKSASIEMITGSLTLTGSELILPKSASIEIITGSLTLTGSELILPKSASIEMITGSLTLTGSELILPKSGSIDIITGSINITTGSQLILPKSSSISTLPSTTGSELILPKSGSNNFISTNNTAKFVDNHKNWGTSSTDVHFLNMAADGQSGSLNDYNVNHIDRRYTFHLIGDVEIYSGSKNKMDDFSNQGRFFNRQIVSDFIHKNVTYNSYMHGTPGTQTGRAIGKTRYFYTSSNSITLPSNHVRKFSNPWTDRMYEGSSNTNPGTLPIRGYEDYGTSSFYRVKVTGGSNEIRVVSGKGSVDKDDNIIY